MGSAINLLKAYCPNPKKLKYGSFKNITGCIETLIEFVQGPCKEN